VRRRALAGGDPRRLDGGPGQLRPTPDERSRPAPPAAAGLAAPGRARVRPVETSTYRVHAHLVASKLEEDSDFHLVIADPRTGGTMIVEFPAISCTLTAKPLLRRRMQAARLAFIRACGFPSSSHFDLLRGAAMITGVGFFDYRHGQTGVAPNAIELHPVIGFKGACLR
jgi:hypothetical protein